MTETVKDFAMNRLVIVVVTALASNFGVMAAIAYPAVHSAFCTVA